MLGLPAIFCPPFEVYTCLPVAIWKGLLFIHPIVVGHLKIEGTKFSIQGHSSADLSSLFIPFYFSWGLVTCSWLQLMGYLPRLAYRIL
jgi:hypothetical protein